MDPFKAALLAFHVAERLETVSVFNSVNKQELEAEG